MLIAVNFLPYILTTEDRRDVVLELERVSAESFVGSKDSEVQFAKVLTPSTFKLVSAVLAQSQVGWENKTKVAEVIQQLRAELLALPELGLTIAFRPNGEALRVIAEKARSLFGDTVILDLKLDRSLIGGAIVTFQGTYLNRTVKRILAEKPPNLNL